MEAFSVKQYDCDDLLNEVMQLEHLMFLSDLRQKTSNLHLITSFSKIQKEKYNREDFVKALNYCFGDKVSTVEKTQIKRLFLSMGV